MKQLMTQLLSVAFVFAPLNASERKSYQCQNSCFKATLCRIEKDLENLTGCGSSISIGRGDIGTTGYVIDKPGSYCLKEDVSYNPSGTNPAIYITAAAVANVSLSLGGHTLSQSSKTVLGVNGIVVDPGLDNVLIANGTVRDFSQTGISVGNFGAPFVTNLTISGINALNNNTSSAYTEGSGGILVNSAENVIVENCNCNQNAVTGFNGFDISQLTVLDSHFDDNTWGELFGSPQTYGFALVGLYSPSNNIYLSNCTFNNNSSIGFVAGLQLTNVASPVNNVLINSCVANNNNATLTDPTTEADNQALGISIDTVGGAVTIENCDIIGTAMTFEGEITPGLGSFNSLVGLLVANINPAGPVTVKNCNIGGQTFTNNVGSGVIVGNQAVSMFEVANDIYISNCHFAGNTNIEAPITGVPSLLLAEGLDLAGVGNVLVEDCFSGYHTQAAQNPGLPEAEFSYAAGFKISDQPNSITGTPGSVIFRRCASAGNTDIGGLGGGAYGFTTRDYKATTTGTNFVFDSCIAENNTNGIGGGYGFDLYNLENTKVINNYAEGNDVGINVSDFGLTVNSNYIVSANVLLANNDFGIRDQSTTGNTNAYFQNRAKANGASPAIAGSDTNYTGGLLNSGSTPFNPTSAPIRYWVLPNQPNQTNNNGIQGESLDNFSINL